MLTWGELKRYAEEHGVTDDTVIALEGGDGFAVAAEIDQLLPAWTAARDITQDGVEIEELPPLFVIRETEEIDTEVDYGPRRGYE